MTLRNPLIHIEKYVTQFGQLQHMTRNRFGDTVVTSVSTVKCLVYQEEDRQEQTNPAVTRTQRMRAVIASSITVNLADHLVNVVDQFGNVVLPEARIDAVIDYNHWRFGPRFKKLELDTEMNG